ncbi:NACHT domain-containing protein [Vibrio sp. DNB22_12_1]
MLAPLNELLKDVYRIAKGPLQQAMLSCLTEEAQKKRDSYIEHVEYVKTIWQIDKAVSVTSFYYPTALIINKKPTRINNVNELFLESKSVIIQGVAGQGKSIFLRYLATETYKSDRSIPIFIQLRHISKDMNLQDLVVEVLSDLGIVNDTNVIEFFMRRGDFIFFLDGFDEIAEEFRSETIRTVERYTHKYKNVRIAITSRPNSEIEHSMSFDVFKIKPLSDKDRVKLIKLLVYDLSVVNSIVEALNKNDKISDVLTTPLLVTLLIITYKSESEIPEQLSEFYKSLFQTLVKRHDRTKPGYVRERKSSLGNIELEHLFENLSYISLNNQLISMTEKEYFTSCSSALEMLMKSNIPPEDVMCDISSITCLILLDGDKYYYVHKSVPEFFAAQKIATCDSDTKREIYSQFMGSQVPENWHQTIFFLSEIDPVFYTENLLIPSYKRAFGIDGEVPSSMPKFDKYSFMEFIGKDSELFISKAGGRHSVSVSLSNRMWLVSVKLASSINALFDRFFNEIASEWEVESIVSVTKSTVLLGKIFDDSHKWPSFLSYVNSNSSLVNEYALFYKCQQDLKIKKRVTLPLLKLKI